MTDLVLTEEQLAIVEHPLEPLRVAAGAGTGKTTTIVLRLREAIDRGNIQPEQALGITFTNKAAEELADRLRRELPELALEGREVEVTTYHGFAHRLLQEFGALVGVERNSEVIGQGFVRQLLLEALGDGSYEALDLTSPPHRVAEAATLARQLGENLQSPEVLFALDAIDEVALARRELATIVASYQRAKAQLGVVDYADLIGRAHELVTRHPDIAARIAGRYRLVLLDEYQDTDPSQRVLLTTLFGGAHGPVAVTAVGDADQTIYEWRGASLENFASFPRHFPTPAGDAAPTRPLTVNRRSDRLILDVANAIKAQLHGIVTDPLQPAPDPASGTVQTAFFRTAVEEATWIADEVRRLHDEEAVPWSEIAVLFRKNRHMSLVRDALEAVDVPLEVVSLGGLLSVPEVIDLHAWLRIIEFPDDSAALVRILRFGRYRLGLGDLAVLTRWVRERGRAEPADDDESPGWPLLEAIDRLDEVQGFSLEAATRLEEFRDAFRSLLADAQSVSLVELCRRVLDRIEAWAEIEAMPAEQGLTARLNLYRFLDLAEAWSPLRGRPSLEAFLGYLEVLQDERVTEELDTARVSSEDAVSLLTVHRAKGLEWDVVFVPAVVDQNFPAKSLGFDNPVQRAQYLPFDLRLDRDTYPDPSTDDVVAELRGRHEAQEWRTAYVAVTRARHRLCVTGAHWYGSQTARSRSALFSVVAGVAGVRMVHECAEAGEQPDRLVLPDLDGAPDPLFGEEGWAGAIRRTLGDEGWPRTHAGVLASAYDEAVDQLRMVVEGLPEPAATPPGDRLLSVSVTGLVTLAGCPKRYYWSEVDRLPRRPNPAATRGVEFHRRVELFHRGVVPFDDLEPELYDGIELDSGDEAGPPDRGAPFEVFEASRFAAVRPAYVEVPIDLRVGEARVAGRIDAVYEPDPGSWEIVDFKSGRPGSATEARRVQLEAYALAAVDGAVASVPPRRIDVTFAYFGGGQLIEQSESVDALWIERARNRLGSLIEVAGGEEFRPTPSTACSGCDFLQFCAEGSAFLRSRSSTL